MSMSVCTSVRTYVTVCGTTCPNSTKCTVRVAFGRGSVLFDGVVIRFTVYTSGFDNLYSPIK